MSLLTCTNIVTSTTVFREPQITKHQRGTEGRHRVDMGRWNGEALAFVITVSFVVLFIPLSVEFIILLPWLSPLTSRSLLLLLAYNLSVSMLIINYVLVMKTDPGSPDPAYVPDGLGHFGEVDAERVTDSFHGIIDGPPTAGGEGVVMSAKYKIPMI
ncbi:hypothetical protein HDU67_006859 [Dinochytrium kinnereticum]|nr:hypothetical protein HDU67_006859 [Dinochytrium kinnereticum]